MCFEKSIVPGLAAGLVYLILDLLISFVVVAVLPFDINSIGGMRAASDPLMVTYFITPFVLGIAMAVFYSVVGKSFKGDCLHKSLKFGLLVWGVSGLYSALAVLTSMDYPIGFTVVSFLGSLVCTLAAAKVIVKLHK